MNEDFFQFEIPTTTAIYPNRLKDKSFVESTVFLPEIGNNFNRFLTPNGTLFSVGYVRVVYGDHGPYVEFKRTMIQMKLIKKFDKEVATDAYYEWLLPSDGSDMKIYDQRRDVKHLKNPPKGGFQGNRSEGYADYKVGMIYVNPFEIGMII